MARIRNKRQKELTQAALPLGFTALYIRVSTDKQADEGYSLDAQRNTLRSYCNAHGWLVRDEHIYVDAGLSGKSTSRPEYQRMIHAAQAGQVQRVVAVKLDRLARNTRDFLGTVERLREYGCDLVLIKESFDTGTPHGKFALTMFAAIAELEASQITERVMSGKRQKATEGGYNGSACPLGYNFNDGSFVPNEDAGTVRSIFSMFVDEGLNLSTIAHRLNEKRKPTAKGGRWYPATVRYILNNGMYAGLVQWDGTESQGNHISIVKRGIYEQAVKRLNQLRPGPISGT